MDTQIQQLQAQIQALQDQLAAGQPANPPQVPARAYKPIVPKTYSGGRTEKLEPWLFQVERYCEMALVPIADRVKFTGGLLEGNPASWWLAVHGIIEHLPVREQWESFKT